MRCAGKKNIACRALSMWGNPDNFERATQLAHDLMEEKLRIDVCNCMGFQKKLTKGETRNKNKVNSKNNPTHMFLIGLSTNACVDMQIHAWIARTFCIDSIVCSYMQWSTGIKRGCRTGGRA